MASELKSRTIRAAGWSFVETLGQRSVQFVAGIILARLLLPEQFGLLGMLMVFILVGQTFLDSGFGAALIQKQDITKKDINSVFYFNIFISIVVVVCLFILSPFVARFYGQPILSPLLKTLSLTLVINAFGLIQNVLMVKAIDFKTQTKVTFTASSLSGIVGIVMAWRGYGVWSLAGQQISDSVFRTILLWIFNSWRPAWVFSFQSLHELFRFGAKLLASNLLNTFSDNIYLIVIGKLFPLADLGNFSMAKDTQRVPMTILSRVVNRVTFPVFSTIQDDQERIKRGVKKTLTLLASVHFPLMLGLAVIARPLVLIILTEKWVQCVPYMQLLCFAGILYPMNLINLNVLQAMGKSNLFLRLEIIKNILMVLNVSITFRWGILAIIEGQIIISLLNFYFSAYYNKKLISYPISEQIHDIYPYLLAAIFTAVSIYFVCLPIINPFLLLFCQIAAGSVVYLAICQLFKLSVYVKIKRIIADKNLSPKGIQ